MPKRKKILEEKTAWLSETFCPQKGPINLEKIAEKFKIKLHYGDFNGDFEGLIVYSNGRFTIFFHRPDTQTINPARLRFSFAHEIGHYFISTHRQELIRTGSLQKNTTSEMSSDPYIEKEADFFAANLLMPSPWLISDFANKPFSTQLITQTANFYEVSLLAALNRYATLGPDPIMIVNSTAGQIPGKNLPNRSKLFPFHQLKNSPSRSVPQNSLAAELNTQPHRSGFQSKQLIASDWFSSSNPAHLQQPLIETCYQHEGSKQITSILQPGLLSNNETNIEQLDSSNLILPW